MSLYITNINMKVILDYLTTLYCNHRSKFYNILIVIILIISSPLASCKEKTIKIFQIGPSRCGTTTLSDFFNANGVISVHHDYGRVAQSMYGNYLSKKPLMSGKYNGYIGYFDMISVYTDFPIYGPKYFKELDAQYPGSKFILNTRDKKALFKSFGKEYLENFAKQYSIPKEQVVEMWSREFDRHYANVVEYFKDRPNDLIIFNIETDKPEKLVEFFKDYFVLDPKLYIHKNKTLVK